MGLKVFALAIAGTAICFLLASNMPGTAQGSAAAVEQVAVAQLDTRSDRLSRTITHAVPARVEVSGSGERRTAGGIRIVGPVFLPEK